MTRLLNMVQLVVTAVKVKVRRSVSMSERLNYFAGQGGGIRLWCGPRGAMHQKHCSAYWMLVLVLMFLWRVRGVRPPSTLRHRRET